MGSQAQGKMCQFKLVLFGCGDVGKSSSVLRFVNGQFNEHRDGEFRPRFFTHAVCLDDTTVKFVIWDTNGQSRYRSSASVYYRGAHAAIVVYDITNWDSFWKAKEWVEELQIEKQARPNIVIALAGNKSDLANKRMIEFDKAQAYAEENSLLFMETSAKTAMNVNDIFLTIAKKLLENGSGGERGGCCNMCKQQ